MRTATVLSRMAVAAALACTLTWAAETPKAPAKADTYPLDTCVVTGAKLGGEMGKAVKYDYKGREIRFCCQGCIKTFEQDPAKYLKKLDDAAKAKEGAAKATVAPAAGNAVQPAK